MTSIITVIIIVLLGGLRVARCPLERRLVERLGGMRLPTGSVWVGGGMVFLG